MNDPGVNVVLIEDEKQIRRFVKAALEAEGITVHEADTGQRGLIEAATRKPDLIIVDLGLPDTDGLEVIREFARLDRVTGDRAVGAQSGEREGCRARCRRRRLLVQAVWRVGADGTHPCTFASTQPRRRR